MNITAIRQRPQWLLIGIILSAAIIGGILRVILAQEASSTATDTQPIAPAETEETAQLFESPMIALSAELRKAATPSELVQSTASDDRLSVVTTGRADPFAPITRTISATTSPSRREAAAAEAAAPQIAVSSDRVPVSPNLPTTSISQVPDLPPVPSPNAAPPPLPAIPIAINPLPIPALPSSIPGARPVPQSPIEAVELTGVVQVGDRVGVIVREGNGQSSRHVFAGDLLAGGQVRLKAVDLSAQQPLVILEYQGEEYTRIVG
ncbi:MAG: hypothetical protein F6K00_13795 [Leptolyngbya sp. SIOISBB]|nr:hypothetical protein [Leptolyngbya sp. SIOISBB]